MSTGSAKRLAQSIRNTPAKSETIEDEGVQSIIKAMQARGIIGNVPEMPEEAPEEPMRWYDIALALKRHHDEYMAQREAEAKAEEARPSGQSAAALLSVALSNANHSAMPLNGAQVLRAALGGGSGTINGEPA